jgi:hypothetical protein
MDGWMDGWMDERAAILTHYCAHNDSVVTEITTMIEK